MRHNFRLLRSLAWTVLGSALIGCSTGTDSVQVAEVTVNSPTAPLYVGGDLQLSARALDSEGNEITSPTFTWKSDNEAVATVSASGLAHGVSVGSTTFRATLGAQTGTLALAAVQAPVVSVTIEPASPSVQTGASLQLMATLQDALGSRVDRPVTWSSQAEGVATISASGVVMGVGRGTTLITVKSEGAQGQTTLTVSPPPFAERLPDGRVRIHPSVVAGLAEPLWLAWMGNEFLARQEQEAPYRGVAPNPVNRLTRITSGDRAGWYESAVPVAGTCFTAVQFNGTTRRWANLEPWTGVSGIYSYQGHSVMKVPDDGHESERLDAMIRVSTGSDLHRYVFLSNAVLPTADLAAPWRLVGSSNDWTYGSGRTEVGGPAGGFSFDASGLRRYANVRARSTAGTDVWGLFNVLADGSIDLSSAGCSAGAGGYHHPNLHTDGTSTGIWFEPPEMPRDTPYLFVNGLEGRVGWPNPNQPPNTRIVGTFRAATPWLTMVHDMRTTDSSWVDIDYLRLYAVVNGQNILVEENAYEDGRRGGTLATRSSWFGSTWDVLVERSSIRSGVLHLPLSTEPLRAWHVWVEDSWPTSAGPNWRHLLPDNTQKVWVTARVRIRGPAALQLGWDYYRSTDDKGCDVDKDGAQDNGWCEAGKTDWIFETFDNDGWQIITLGR